MWQQSAAKTDFISRRVDENRAEFILHSDHALSAAMRCYVSTSVAGGCAGGVGGVCGGNSSGVLPGNSRGGAGESGSCIGGGTSGPGCGLPGGSSRGGSAGRPGLTGGISVGWSAIACLHSEVDKSLQQFLIAASTTLKIGSLAVLTVHMA
jgi:hypothetical protein